MVSLSKNNYKQNSEISNNDNNIKYSIVVPKIKTNIFAIIFGIFCIIVSRYFLSQFSSEIVSQSTFEMTIASNDISTLLASLGYQISIVGGVFFILVGVISNIIIIKRWLRHNEKK